MSRLAFVMPGFTYPVMYLGRMSDGRTPALSQSDMYVQKEFLLRDRYRLAVGFTVTNLFNQATVTSKYPYPDRRHSSTSTKRISMRAA